MASPTDGRRRLICAVWYDGRMDESELPTIPFHVRCDVCGETAIVARRRTTWGEQVVVVRMDDAFYITIDCPTCGKRQQVVTSKS
jgi:ribosomal protein S27E